MAKITITIDGDNVTINQSATPTKVENTIKRYFIIIGCYDENSWIELVTEDYIKAANKILDLKLFSVLVTYFLTNKYNWSNKLTYDKLNEEIIYYPIIDFTD